MTNEDAIEVLKNDIEICTIQQKQACEMAIKALEPQPSDDCIRRDDVDAYIAKLMSGYLYDEERTRLEEFSAYLWELPSVTPERPNPDVVEKMKKAIDEMTEIHSDGEFYIKNVDAKWIIGKYLYGAEMSGGEEDENNSGC